MTKGIHAESKDGVLIVSLPRVAVREATPARDHDPVDAGAAAAGMRLAA